MKISKIILVLSVLLNCQSINHSVSIPENYRMDEETTILWAKEFNCKFKYGISSQYNRETNKLISQIDNEFPPITIQIINSQKKTAQFLSNGGVNPLVQYFTFQNQFHFIEYSSSGTTYTTVFPVIYKSKEVAIVHSRNMELFGNVLSSQYYGFCKIKSKVGL